MSIATKMSSADVPMLRECTVLGSSGFPFAAGDATVIAFYDNEVSCNSATHQVKFSLLELAEVSITGPGTVTTGGGFIGGGFGVEGTLQGMAIAGVLNAITTKKKVQTFITLVTNFGELHLHYGQMEPGSLRIYLSDVFAKLRRLNSRWIQDREQLIDSQRAKAAITEKEAENLKARLASPPVWQNLKVEAEARLLLGDATLESTPKGICPSCDKVIPLLSETCPHCRANFGEYASWKVLPIA